MLQFKAPPDLKTLADSHRTYLLVQDLIDSLVTSLPLHTANASLTTGLNQPLPSHHPIPPSASGVAARANRRPLGVAATTRVPSSATTRPRVGPEAGAPHPP